jgi:hypothetical protein
MILAAYHQGFKNRKATEEAVKNFRKQIIHVIMEFNKQ